MLKNVQSVLVPVDFSENSVKILQEAINVAIRFEAHLKILFVVQSLEDYSGFFVPHMPIAQFHDEMLESSERKMIDFLAENLNVDIANDWKVISGDVGEEIVAFAEEEKVGMIVMGTHGYKGLERILFGSVAEQVVKSAHCPVLVINPYKIKVEDS